MKAIIIILGFIISGCATTVKPLPPAHNSIYRKTIEVIAISCQKDLSTSHKRSSHRYGGEISIVESTETGERFQVHGCLGKAGERFKISY